MDVTSDYYSVLEVASDASDAEIQTAFKRLVKEQQSAQRTGGELQRAHATERIALLISARTALKPHARAKYNQRAVFGSSAVDMDEIVPGIWLGAMSAALQAAVLRAHGISLVLTVACGLHIKLPDDIQHRVVHVRDEVHEDLLAHMEEALAILSHGRAEGKGVLVHCFAGVSRSATVVLAYLMREARRRGTPRPWLGGAFRVVSGARPRVDPNPGFIRQLLALEALGCPETLPAKLVYQPLVDEADIASLEIEWSEAAADESRAERVAEERTVCDVRSSENTEATIQ